ncbi:MAG: molecular chaperone TorD family protein [Desulfobacterales bacterium]
MNNVSVLSPIYRLIAELFLYPEERDNVRIEKECKSARQSQSSIQDSIDKFLAEPASFSSDEYMKLFELSSTCPLYLGSYLFDEPKSCRGMGLSGRNAYMIELANIYKHFGFELNGGELPDFLSVMVDFLWISLEKIERDRIGLRRHFLEHYLLPGIEPLSAALKKHKSPYIGLMEALEAALKVDVAFMSDKPTWKPPDENFQHQNRGMEMIGELNRKRQNHD